MFHWLELRGYCHATEDESKVEKAMRSLSPSGRLLRQATEGHFGNPLLVLEIREESAAEIENFWRQLEAAGVLSQLARTLRDRVDENCVLHFRLDKQAAYLGRISLSAGDDTLAVAMKVRANPSKKSVAVKALEEHVRRGV